MFVASRSFCHGGENLRRIIGSGLSVIYRPPLRLLDRQAFEEHPFGRDSGFGRRYLLNVLVDEDSVFPPDTDLLARLAVVQFIVSNYPQIRVRFKLLAVLY